MPRVIVDQMVSYYALMVGGGTPPVVPVPTTYLGPIETGNTLLGTDTVPVTTGQAKQDTRHTIRGGGTGMVLTFSGVEWNTMQGEILLPSYTAQAQIIPDATGIAIDVTVGGQSTFTVDTATRFVDTDPVTRTWMDGENFTLRVLATGARLPALQPAGTTNSQLFTDEACQTAASGLTIAGAPTDSLNRRRRVCVVVAISGQRSADATTVACIGDSIMAYQTSTLVANSSTADHVRGDVVRSLSQYYACYNLGIGADQPSSSIYSDRTLQRMLARRCSHVFDEFGVNEIENRAILGDQAWAFHLRHRAIFAGRKYAHSTLVPRTTGTFADEAGQAADATKTARINAYNALARAASDQTWDRRLLIQGTDPDKWAAGFALDGLHPTLAAQDAIIADKATSKAKIDTAAAIPANAQPPLTLTLTGTPTFVGGAFARGTATGDGMAASALPSSMEFYANATAVSGFDVLCGAAGRLYVDASGFPTYTRQGTGTQYRANTPASIVGTGEHFFRVVTTATNTNIYMDDLVTPLITVAVVPNSTQTNTRVVATVTNAAGSIRDLTSWASSRTGVAPAAGAIPAAQTGLVAYWPLSTDGSGQFGPYLNSI